MKKAVILLSGGIDSATTLYLARKRGFSCTALIFNYGQRHRKEIEFAKKISKRAGCPYRVIKLPFFWKSSSLLDKKMRLPVRRSFQEIRSSIPSTYVPARNIIFLSIATSFAESINACAIFMGSHTEDYSGYPDCRKRFFDAFRRTVRAGTKCGKHIRIYTPLIDKSKKVIIKIGLQLKIPFELTWSCYSGQRSPCGICDSCLFRARAFRELGIVDPYFLRKDR